MRRFKVTRVEIWEVEDVDGDFADPNFIHDLQASIQDDILNSQDVCHETDDNAFEFTPKELVALKVEAAH